MADEAPVRTYRRLLAAGLAAILLAAGCAGGAATQRDTTVQLLVFGAPEELAAYRTLAAAYGRARPGGRVQLVEASDRTDLITRLSTSIAGGEPPDIFLMNYRFYGQFAAKGAIEPVGERLRSSAVIKATDLYPVAMEAFRWRGEQLCMPQNVSSLVVYYNRDLFTKYGVPEPKPGWTWNDMVATASALTRDANGVAVVAEPEEGGPEGGEPEGAARPVATYGLGVEPSIIRLAPFVWSNGGEIVDNPQRPTRFTLDTPKAREVLRNLVDLRLAYGVVPTDEEVEAEADESRFANGRLAMLLSSRRSTTTFRAITDFAWDVAPLPTYGRQVGILHSDAYCITRGARDKDAAWRFVEYAMSAEGQRIISATGRTVPSHIQVSRSAAFLDPAHPPRRAQVFLDAIPTVRTMPTVSTWPEIEDVVQGILENALYRGDRLDDVVRDIDRQTRPLFARAEGP
jgi:multiple sugar transport system substrate-binding protein